jgi:serine/threonine protein kinase
MPYTDGKDLYELMEANNFKPLPTALVRKIMQQLISAVGYCHDKGIAHMDIKLENMLLTPDDHLFLIDFGLCQLQPSLIDSRFLGSPGYACPEMIQRTPYSGYKADAWSIGTVMYALLHAVFPFVEDRILSKEQPELEFPFKIDKQAKQIIQGLMAVDPKKRTEVKRLRQHKWFASKKNKWKLF